MRLKGYPRIDGAPDSLYDTSALPEDWTDSEVQAQIEMREKAWRDRASQMASVREEERQVWQAVIAGKDAELADKDVKLANKDAELAKKNAKLAGEDAESEWLRSEIANKDAELTNKNAEIQRLQARVAELKAMSSR